MPDTRDLVEGLASHAAARERIATWLLDGPAQLRAGAHAGGVAGSVDLEGSALYVYPEITGYFLQWLAWRTTQGDVLGNLAPRAHAAQAWLARWAADAWPPTRAHLFTTRDWRNDATFTFDVAMVLRGVASAARAGLTAPDGALVARVCERLVDAIGDDGLLEACRPHPGASSLPRGWSTRRGPFLAKAAAAVLTACDTCAVPARLRLACAITLEDMLEQALRAPHAELHPALYTVEGVLLIGDARVLAPFAASVAMVGDAVVGTDRDGMTNGGQRFDVRAQALRAGCALRDLGVASGPASVTLDALAQPLAAAVTEEGALPFAPGDDTRNVWAAMFAEQALGWLDGSADTRWLV